MENISAGKIIKLQREITMEDEVGCRAGTAGKIIAMAPLAMIVMGVAAGFSARRLLPVKSFLESVSLGFLVPAANVDNFALLGGMVGLAVGTALSAALINKTKNALARAEAGDLKR